MGYPYFLKIFGAVFQQVAFFLTCLGGAHQFNQRYGWFKAGESSRNLLASDSLSRISEIQDFGQWLGSEVGKFSGFALGVWDSTFGQSEGGRWRRVQALCHQTTKITEVGCEALSSSIQLTGGGLTTENIKIFERKSWASNSTENITIWSKNHI